MAAALALTFSHSFGVLRTIGVFTDFGFVTLERCGVAALRRAKFLIRAVGKKDFAAGIAFTAMDQVALVAVQPARGQ